MFRRAVERGELPSETDLELLRDLVLGSAQALILFRHEEFTDEKIERAVVSCLREQHQRKRAA